VTFTDDPWAPQEAVELFAKEFSATRPQILTLSPADLGVAKIGHMGFFRPELRDTLWRGSAEWLEADAPVQRVYPAAARAS
jgi:predicted alpha/beta hydrolase